MGQLGFQLIISAPKGQYVQQTQQQLQQQQQQQQLDKSQDSNNNNFVKLYL